MAVATFFVLLPALFSYALAQDSSECNGPTPFCEDIVDQAATIEEAWLTYGATSVELATTVLTEALAAAATVRDLRFQQCMFRINDKFDGETVAPTTDKLCRRALEIPVERDAIDFYNDSFFFGLLVDLVHGVAVALLQLSDQGGDCNVKECSYLISETFPKIFDKKEEDNKQALKRILEELVDDENKVEEEDLEKKSNVLMKILNELLDDENQVEGEDLQRKSNVVMKILSGAVVGKGV